MNPDEVEFNVQSTTFLFAKNPWDYSNLSILHRALCHKLVMARLSQPNTRFETNVASDLQHTS